MKYKLIAIDLDGTLLNDDKIITELNKITLQKLIKSGYEIVIATGRRYSKAKRFVEVVNKNLVILANNGNIVRNIKDDKVLLKKYLDVDDFHTLIREGKDKGLYPIIHSDYFDEGYDIFIEFDVNDTKYSSYLTGSIDGCKRVEDFMKIEDPRVLTVVYLGDKDKLESFNLEINKKYPDKYSSHVMENITIAGALLEVMHPLGSKWLSLEEYSKSKGISKEEIIAIGDDNNDIDMIKKAGLGIAMKNASLGVKNVADIITEEDNNEDGVAHILKKVLKV